MAQKRNRNKHKEVPVERHNTAAWANASEFKPASKVSIPDETQIINAKEYVDTNQK